MARSDDFILNPEARLEPQQADEFFELFAAKPCPPPPVNPRVVTPNNDPAQHPSPAPGASLVEDFGSLADDLRQLHTDFGTRPYRVFSVIYRWSGGEEGLGDEQLVRETEFLPTPLVNMGNLRNEMTAAGQKLQGTASLEQLSPRYTEDNIRALFPTQLPLGFYSFVEIRMDARDGSQPVRRRFTVKDVPYRRADKFDWYVPLAAQQTPRNRQGGLNEEPTLYPEWVKDNGSA